MYPLMSLFRICPYFYQPRTLYVLIFPCAYKKLSVANELHTARLDNPDTLIAHSPLLYPGRDVSIYIFLCKFHTAQTIHDKNFSIRTTASLYRNKVF